MDAKQFLKLLTGYLRNTLNASDRALLQQWYDSFDEEKREVPGLENESSEEQLKQELHSRIYRTIRQPGRPVERKLIPFRRIAAAVTIIVIAGIAFRMLVKPGSHQQPIQLAQETYREISTGVRQVKRVQLPDSSIIHLNANSKIRIPHLFASTNRQVYLDEGEAFFEVAKDPDRPFLVNASSLIIKVLGTSFNVRSYRNLDHVTITVATGQVQVSDSLQKRNVLKANQQFTYNKLSTSSTVSAADPDRQESWKTGVVYLEKAGFNELALAMYNIYGIRLKSEHLHTNNFSYNLTIRSDRSLKETMDLICFIHNTKFRRQDNDVIIYP